MRRTTRRYLFVVIVVTLINILIYIFSFQRLKYYCKTEYDISEKKINNRTNERLANYFYEKQLFQNNNDVCVNNNKYLRFECKRPLCGGWADRLRGLMSAYVWAIFTKREFLIDIDYPCSLTNMLEPNIVKWNTPIKCYDYQVSNTAKNDFVSVRLDKVSNKKFYSLLRDLDIFEYYKEANLITVKNNLDWVYAFSFNKLLYKSIQEFGYKPENFKLYYFFRKFYHDLFKLTPSLQKRYNEFLRLAKPDNSTKLICTQIRIGGVRPNVAFDMEFMPLNSSKLFWKFIRDNFLNVKSKQKYKIFVTTDTESVENECIKEFGHDNVVRFEGPFIHIDREYVGNKSDCSRVEKVILDFHALQVCDIAIISQSGFGRLGISNRIEPAKELYRFQREEPKSKTNKKYIFKKIENLDML